MIKDKKLKKTKKINKSLFRRINDWLHLWLGLISGGIIFVVSITGAIYTFQKEIKDYIEDWRFVPIQNKAFVPPSVLIETAQKEFPDKKPTGLTYAPKDEAAAVGFESMLNGKHQFSVVFMNPYDASVIKKQTMGETFDFFNFIIQGHRGLWLPYPIGKNVIGISVIIFLILIISGLIMWFPKKWKKSNINQAFKIKWNASFKRVNYDLHNVLGFYVMLVALVFAVTGLVWSFDWFAKSYYYTVSGGEVRGIDEHPHSNIAHYKENTFINNIDKAWYKVINEIKTVNGGVYISPQPREKDDPIEIVVFNQYGKFYDKDEYFFDQYTLQSLRQKGDRFSDANFADMLMAMNYDLHTGSILGIAGKILVFICSLICASLPITGFLVWWNKKNISKNKN